MDRVEFALKNLKGKILDVGYSVGGIHEKFKETFGAENIYGIDIETTKDTEHYKKASAEKIPFPKENFNSIFAGELIEHIENPELFVKESNRVLKTKGIFILTTPNKKSLINRIFHSYETPIHISLFSFPELNELLEKNGFVVETFFCQPYSGENCYGSKNKWSFIFRKIIHACLPKNLQEQMIVKAIKVK